MRPQIRRLSGNLLAAPLSAAVETATLYRVIFAATSDPSIKVTLV